MNTALKLLILSALLIACGDSSDLGSPLAYMEGGGSHQRGDETLVDRRGALQVVKKLRLQEDFEAQKEQVAQARFDQAYPIELFQAQIFGWEVDYGQGKRFIVPKLFIHSKGVKKSWRQGEVRLEIPFALVSGREARVEFAEGASVILPPIFRVVGERDWPGHFGEVEFEDLPVEIEKIDLAGGQRSYTGKVAKKGRFWQVVFHLKDFEYDYLFKDELLARRLRMKLKLRPFVPAFVSRYQLQLDLGFAHHFVEDLLGRGEVALSLEKRNRVVFDFLTDQLRDFAVVKKIGFNRWPSLVEKVSEALFRPRVHDGKWQIKSDGVSGVFKFDLKKEIAQLKGRQLELSSSLLAGSGHFVRQMRPDQKKSFAGPFIYGQWMELGFDKLRVEEFGQAVSEWRRKSDHQVCESYERICTKESLGTGRGEGGHCLSWENRCTSFHNQFVDSRDYSIEAKGMSAHKITDELKLEDSFSVEVTQKSKTTRCRLADLQKQARGGPLSFQLMATRKCPLVAHQALDKIVVFHQFAPSQSLKEGEELRNWEGAIVKSPQERQLDTRVGIDTSIHFWGHYFENRPSIGEVKDLR